MHPLADVDRELTVTLSGSSEAIADGAWQEGPSPARKRKGEPQAGPSSIPPTQLQLGFSPWIPGPAESSVQALLGHTTSAEH